MLAGDVGVLGLRRGRVERGVGARTDEREDRAGVRHVLADHVLPDGELVDHPLDELLGVALGVEPEAVLETEDANVGAELALRVEEGGVAAFAGSEPLDVVRHLALEELGGAGAREELLRAVGAVDQRDVGRRELVGVGSDHATDSTNPPPRP